MNKKYLAVLIVLLVLVLGGVGLTTLFVQNKENEEGDLRVVTSFYPVYIATLNVTGSTEGVTVENLSEPQTGCLHDYQLTPEDMKLLSAADVFVVNGGGIESFLTDVAEEYPDLSIINASESISLDGDNAHAWMSIDTYMQQINAIMDGLTEADASHEKEFRANSDAYLAKLSVLKEEQSAIAQAALGTPVVSFHEAYEYVAADYGMDILYTLNLDEERQVSAGEVADVIDTITSKGVKIVLAEELYGSDMGETVSKETDAKVYYLDTCVRGEYEADSYIKAMEENMSILRDAFGVTEE